MDRPVTYSNRQIWQIAYPILISLIMEQLIGMTDTAFMGRVGEIELGASAIAGVYYLAIFMLGFGFSVGAQILIARRNGEGNYKMIGGIFYQGLYFLLFMAVVMFVLSHLFSSSVLGELVVSPRICEAAVSYINWRVFGFFFSFAAVMFRAFFVGTTQTKTLTLNSVVMVLSNILFNYILVFGKWGMPALGIVGAAIGSSLAELVSLLFFILYTWKRVDCKKYNLNHLVRFRLDELRHIMKISLWTMIQNAISISTWFLFFIFIEHLGERSLAITNVVRNVSSIPFMIIMAFASTCSSLISNQIGAGDTVHIRATIHQHIRLCSAIVWPIILLIACFPTPILHVYTDLSDLITTAVPTLCVLCGSYLLQTSGYIYFQSVSGTGNTRSAFFLELIALSCYLLYIVVVILIMKQDVAVCWGAEYVYAGVIGLLSFLYMRKASWQKQVI